MKFDKFIAKLKGAQAKFSITALDLIIISEVASSKEKVTIMDFLEGFWRTSPATTHKAIKALAKKKLLKVTNDSEDGRIKLLTVGEKYNELVKYVETV
jgi:DNA-binding MarR family transcriptional regulator